MLCYCSPIVNISIVQLYSWSVFSQYDESLIVSHEMTTGHSRYLLVIANKKISQFYNSFLKKYKYHWKKFSVYFSLAGDTWLYPLRPLIGLEYTHLDTLLLSLKCPAHFFHSPIIIVLVLPIADLIYTMFIEFSSLHFKIIK